MTAQKTGKETAFPPEPGERKPLSVQKSAALCCGAAFLLAALCCVAVAAVQQLVPFGTNRRLFADLYLEYWPYLTELHDKLRAGGSVFYSWAGGMGNTFFGNLCYYLLSPFNIIILLLPRAAIPTAIPVLVGLRQCLAAAAMAAYLSLRKNGKPGAAAAAGGVLYAFCGWFVSYFYNIIWLDGFMLIPLLALGIEKIVCTGKVKLFAITLTLSLFSNFYLSWFAAVFSAIYFLAFYFTNYGLFSPFAGPDGEKAPFFRSRFWQTGLRFAGAAFLSAAVLGVVLAPLALLLVSATPENTFVESYATLFRDLPKQAASLLSGSDSYGTNREVSLSVYSGILPLAALPLLPFKKSVAKKEKYITFGILLFFVLSFNIPFLDAFWHGFRTVTGIPFRETFLFSFFLIAAAHRAVTAPEPVPGRAWIAVGATGLALTGLAAAHLVTANAPVIDAENLCISAVAFLVFVGALAAGAGKNQRLRAAAAAVLLLGACLDAFNHSARNPQIIPEEDYAVLTDTYNSAGTLVAQADSQDPAPFFRTNIRSTDMIYGNYGAQTGLKGIYQSASVVETNYGFLRKLGLDTNESNYVFSDLQTPAFNSLFGVKYTVESDAFIRQGETPHSLLQCAPEGHAKLSDTGSVRLFRYSYALPAGFAADAGVKDWELKDHAAPENQNAFFRLAAGAEDILVQADVTPGAVPEEATLTAAAEDTFAYSCTATETETTARIPFNITPAVSGQLYLYLDMHNEKLSAWGVTCTLNGATMNFTVENNTLFTCLGNVNAGQTYPIEFLCREGGAGSFTLQAVTSVPANMANAYGTLRENGFWQLTESADARLSGTIDVAHAGQIFCTSVPVSRGWHVTLDGEELPQEKILAVGGALIGFEIEQGTHEITLEYRQPGLGAGIAVSAAGALAAAAWLVLDRKKRRSA